MTVSFPSICQRNVCSQVGGSHCKDCDCSSSNRACIHDVNHSMSMILEVLIVHAVTIILEYDFKTKYANHGVVNAKPGRILFMHTTLPRSISPDSRPNGMAGYIKCKVEGESVTISSTCVSAGIETGIWCSKTD